MPETIETDEIVINTGPLIALTAAMGDLKLLDVLYRRVVVPFEVQQEILADNASRFGAAEFDVATWLDRRPSPTLIKTYLCNALDPGEAAVIQTALDDKISTVCIDEHVGRRLARLNGLDVTGTLGVLVRAKQEGYDLALSETITRMQARGIHLSDRVVSAALRLVGER